VVPKWQRKDRPGDYFTPPLTSSVVRAKQLGQLSSYHSLTTLTGSSPLAEWHTLIYLMLTSGKTQINQINEYSSACYILVSVSLSIQKITFNQCFPPLSSRTNNLCRIPDLLAWLLRVVSSQVIVIFMIVICHFSSPHTHTNTPNTHTHTNARTHV